MALPPSVGPFARCEQIIADKLLLCSWFPKFTKEADPFDQRARIHFDKTPIANVEAEIIEFPDLENQRPFVCLWPAQPAGQLAWQAGTNKSAVGLNFQIYFEASLQDAVEDVPTIDPDQDNELFHWWLGMIGAMLWGDSDLGLTGLKLLPDFALHSINNVDMWQNRSADASLGYFSAVATLETGTLQT